MPLPWFTYPAIEYLAKFDFGSKRVFEYGAGQSTLYWAARASQVVTVEHDAAWHRHFASRVPGTVSLVHRPGGGEYPAEIGRHGDGFDVVVVDGIDRLACCRQASERLRAGGVIILDNAERHPDCAALLRTAGLLQVDMTGFGPINGYLWTTSFFFHRDFDFPLKQGDPDRPRS